MRTRAMLSRMCGESQRANSAASLMIPRQSANGLPEVGGGDGQDRYGLLPDAIAWTSTLTWKTVGVGTGPGRVTYQTPCRRRGSGRVDRQARCPVRPGVGGLPPAWRAVARLGAAIP